MVDFAGADRSHDGWAGTQPKSPSVAAGVMLAGITGAAVFAAWADAPWDRAGIFALWVAVGLVAFAWVVSRFRGMRSGRDTADQSGRDRTVVLRGKGAPVQGDARRHRRFVPARRATTLHTRDGRQIAARIVDISIAGVAVEARLTDIDFLAVFRVGTQAAGPVRRTSAGAVFGFDTLLDPQPFDASFVL